jgi:RNA polymerase sigma-70 factor (ECF subfamily)
VTAHSNSPTEGAAPATPDAARQCAVLYTAHGRSIYNFIRLHAESADAAEDLTADTFLRAVRGHHLFDAGRGTARTWIFAIARNVVRDYRRQLRIRRVVRLGGLRDLVCRLPSPEERVLYEDESGRLLEALNRIDEADRELISLRYTSELSPDEIGGLLNISGAAVRTRLWRALGRLRRVALEVGLDDD